MMFTQNFQTTSVIFSSSSTSEATRNRDLFDRSHSEKGKEHETFSSNPKDGLDLPNVIIPAAGDTEDFFATVATYYQDQTPVSALAYVLDKHTTHLFELKYKNIGTPSHSDSKMFRAACLGAALGEATLTGINSRESREPASYSACKRTLSYVLCRATLLFNSEFQPRNLANRWTFLRRLTGLQVHEPITEAALLANELASGNGRSPNLSLIDTPLRDALLRLVKPDIDNDDNLISALISLYPDTSKPFNEMREAFDGRMSAFTRVVDAIQANSHGARIDDIAVAAACNHILPGSFAHADVLKKLVEFYPSALIWYGYFSTIHKVSASQNPNPGLIAKLERDLLETFSFEQRPKCDISLDELEILSRTQFRTETIKPSQQRALLVSLLPGVDVYTRFGTDTDRVNTNQRQDIITHEMHERISKLLNEAMDTLNKARHEQKSTPQKNKTKKTR